jgi:hypothetical protein
MLFVCQGTLRSYQVVLISLSAEVVGRMLPVHYTRLLFAPLDAQQHTTVPHPPS